jgi:tetratricopeptide (TPR) repeat protein
LPQISLAVSAARSNAGYHFALGDVLDHLNYRDLAMKQYAYGLKAEPDYARGLFRLGNDYEVYRHDYPMALSLLNMAHKLAPDDPEISTHFLRLNTRSGTLYNDLALRLRDWLHPAPGSEKD